MLKAVTEEPSGRLLKKANQLAPSENSVFVCMCVCVCLTMRVSVCVCLCNYCVCERGLTQRGLQLNTNTSGELGDSWLALHEFLKAAARLFVCV